ncbi:hypothetical protein MO973_17965 [Paenibacillus sp. TRM 82003]|uniref:hypothetical protein n=1 Tax=Kineococcus sp. TRM81007 TaxID=2925831 RepID=UPI001F58351B|nr:hypothetical protein [Kineococcus sp. TRM81007]MCI2238370.1 hypothetical protein [Kineococcus sp. TRM81007]MCI3922116.1 hypothetical protein [Paenibacillus sp. TRM 82003]
MIAAGGPLPLAATPAAETSTATVTDGPVPTESTVDADLVTPGLGGFISFFLLAVAVYFIGRGMARRVQRVNQRARLEAEERAGTAARAVNGEGAAEPPADRPGGREG